jgi:hypothetical protein
MRARQGISPCPGCTAQAMLTVALCQEIARLHAEVKRLQAQLAQTSANSHKPRCVAGLTVRRYRTAVSLSAFPWIGALVWYKEPDLHTCNRLWLERTDNMRMRTRSRLWAQEERWVLLGIAFLVVLLGSAAPAAAQSGKDDTYRQNEILAKAKDFFGATSKGLAEAIEKVFKEKGRPNGYITGEEASGAVAVGLRYGKGQLYTKRLGVHKVYWQGPSVGFDLGGDAAKVFTLVYHLKKVDNLYQRFPGAEGGLFVVAGFALNYQQSGDIILVPIRTGVGWRAGLDVGYLHYSRNSSWVPF